GPERANKGSVTTPRAAAAEAAAESCRKARRDRGDRVSSCSIARPPDRHPLYFHRAIYRIAAKPALVARQRLYERSLSQVQPIFLSPGAALQGGTSRHPNNASAAQHPRKTDRATPWPEYAPSTSTRS